MDRRLVYAVVALVSGAGLVLNLLRSLTADSPALGTRLVRFFSYFTIESNIFVLVVSLLLAAGAATATARFAIGHLDALIGITVTGLVFSIILAPEGADVDLASVLLHYVSPPLMLLAWLAVGPWRPVTRRAILPALLWPLAFLAWTLIHGAITDWYPYRFIDVGVHGTGTVLRNMVLVVALGLVLALAFVAVNARRGPRVRFPNG
jgi:hypothetical protein